MQEPTPEESPKQKPEADAQAEAVRPEDGEPEHPVQPLKKKIPEGPGNLNRRSKWFQQRSGGSE